MAYVKVCGVYISISTKEFLRIINMYEGWKCVTKISGFRYNKEIQILEKTENQNKI